jgi:hypothetical protein
VLFFLDRFYRKQEIVLIFVQRTQRERETLSWWRRWGCSDLQGPLGNVCQWLCIPSLDALELLSAVTFSPEGDCQDQAPHLRCITNNPRRLRILLAPLHNQKAVEMGFKGDVLSSELEAVNTVVFLVG